MQGEHVLRCMSWHIIDLRPGMTTTVQEQLAYEGMRTVMRLSIERLLGLQILNMDLNDFSQLILKLLLRLNLSGVVVR